jgi:ATP/maltotriose-dependent transcriptional regulator MalT
MLLARCYKHGWRRTVQRLCINQKISQISDHFFGLSDRERQVIALVCDALSNKEIAEKLGVTLLKMKRRR